MGKVNKNKQKQKNLLVTQEAIKVTKNLKAGIVLSKLYNIYKITNSAFCISIRELAKDCFLTTASTIRALNKIKKFNLFDYTISDNKVSAFIPNEDRLTKFFYGKTDKIININISYLKTLNKNLLAATLMSQIEYFYKRIGEFYKPNKQWCRLLGCSPNAFRNVRDLLIESKLIDINYVGERTYYKVNVNTTSNIKICALRNKAKIIYYNFRRPYIFFNQKDLGVCPRRSTFEPPYINIAKENNNNTKKQFKFYWRYRWDCSTRVVPFKSADILDFFYYKNKLSYFLRTGRFALEKEAVKENFNYLAKLYSDSSGYKMNFHTLKECFAIYVEMLTKVSYDDIVSGMKKEVEMRASLAEGAWVPQWKSLFKWLFDKTWENPVLPKKDLRLAKSEARNDSNAGAVNKAESDKLGGSILRQRAFTMHWSDEMLYEHLQKTNPVEAEKFLNKLIDAHNKMVS